MRREDEINGGAVVSGEVFHDGSGVRRRRRNVLVRLRGGGMRGKEGGESGVLRGREWRVGSFVGSGVVIGAYSVAHCAGFFGVFWSFLINEFLRRVRDGYGM